MRLGTIWMVGMLVIATTVWGIPPYEPGVVLIKLNSTDRAFASTDLQAAFHQKMGAKSTSKIKFVSTDRTAQVDSGWIRVELDEKTNIQDAVADYAKQPWVAYAEPNYPVQLHTLTNDPYADQQGYLTQTELSSVLNWVVSQNVLVAVVDSGVDYLHPDLASNVASNTAPRTHDLGDGILNDTIGYNFYGYTYGYRNADPMDYFGHGTHIAGIIAAQSNNGIGIIGVDDKARIIPVCFLNESGYGFQADAAVAIRYAADRGARVINCSWGFTSYDQVLQEAIVYAQSKGSIVVASAGNSSTSVAQYPAAFSQVIAIAALDSNGRKTSYSNWGNYVSFACIGDRIYSLAPNGQYVFKTGTSQSAAIVSGIIAKMLAFHPGWGYTEVFNALKNASQFSQSRNLEVGYGAISGVALTQEVALSSGSIVSSQIESTANLTVSNVLNFPNPVTQTSTRFGFNSSESGTAQVQIYNSYGKLQATVESAVIKGYNTLPWNVMVPQALPNGTYFYVLTVQSGGQVVTTKGKLAILH